MTLNDVRWNTFFEINDGFHFWWWMKLNSFCYFAWRRGLVFCGLVVVFFSGWLMPVHWKACNNIKQSSNEGIDWNSVLVTELAAASTCPRLTSLLSPQPILLVFQRGYMPFPQYCSFQCDLMQPAANASLQHPLQNSTRLFPSVKWK